MSSDGTRVIIGAIFNDANEVPSGHARVFELVVGKVLQHPSGFSSEEH
jgi:hypothetical protein